MNEAAPSRFDRWSSRAGLSGLLALVCAVLAPDGSSWTGRLAAAGLVGSLVAMAALLGRWAMPLMAGVSERVEAEPLRSRGDEEG